jgi:O-antigen/teichoic acid export membrane protein
VTRDAPSLAAKGSRGAATTLLFQLSGQVLTIGATAVVARRLGPQPYGLLGFALLVGLPLAGVADLGLGQALMRGPKQSQETIASAFWITVGGGASAAAIAVPISLFVATRYGVHSSGWLVAVGAMSITLAMPAAAPRALLARSFQFGRLAASDFLAQVASGLVMLVLALSGAGAWSLMLGLSARSIVGLASVIAFARFLPTRAFHPRSLKPLWPFGLRASASGTLSYVARNIDDLLVARFLGATALGLYRVGFGIALLPFTYLGLAIGNVVLPTFGSITDDPVRVRLGFLRATRALAYLNTGITIAMWWLAALTVEILYGHAFVHSVAYLRILCLAALLYPLGALSGSVMLALGRADLELKLTALRAIATGLFAYAGWLLAGAHGIAWGVAAYALVMSTLDLIVAGRLVTTTATELLRALAPSALVGGVTFATLELIERATDPGTPTRLLLTAASGALYIIVGLRVDRELVGALVPSLRPRGAAPPLVLEEHGNPG